MSGLLRLRCLYITIFLTMDTLLMAEGAHIPIVPGQQEVFISFSSDSDPEFAADSGVQSFCKEYGEALLLNDQTAGSFARYHCDGEAVALPEKSKTALDDTKEAAIATTKPDRYWAIRFAQEGGLLVVEISYNLSDAVTKIRAFKFTGNRNLKTTLTKKDFSSILARMTIEALPIGFGVDFKNGEAIKFPSSNKALAPPKSLFMYTLIFDPVNKLWIPKVVARLKLSSTKEPNSIPETSYKLSVSYAVMPTDGKYWVQNQKGINARQKAYEAQLKNLTKDLSLLSLFDELIIQSLSSNYAGIRLGKSLLNGNELVTKSSLITGFFEMRDGFFEGLRLYYDSAPKREDGVQYFGWSRFSLGVAFTYDMPELLTSFISRVDIQPRIGILNLDTNLAIDGIEEEFNLQFKTKNSPDIGLELGTEKQLAWFRARLFAGFSISRFGVSPTNDAISVASTRIGIDNYFDLFNIGHIEFNGLLYGCYEYLSLSKTPKKVSADSSVDGSTLNISSLAFNQLFLGGGLTVSW